MSATFKSRRDLLDFLMEANTKKQQNWNRSRNVIHVDDQEDIDFKLSNWAFHDINKSNKKVFCKTRNSLGESIWMKQTNSNN